MATLESILNPPPGDPSIPQVRRNIEESLKAKRWEAIAKQADIDSLSSPIEGTDPGSLGREMQRQDMLAARRFEMETIVRAFSSLEARLAALPAE